MNMIMINDYYDVCEYIFIYNINRGETAIASR